MGTNITITVDEYNALKSKITSLEKELVALNRNYDNISEKYSYLKEAYEYVTRNTTMLERIFQWKSILRAAERYVEKYVKSAK